MPLIAVLLLLGSMLLWVLQYPPITSATRPIVVWHVLEGLCWAAVMLLMLWRRCA